MEASLIIPTYNEAENIVKIVEKAMQISADSNLDLELLIIDDNSPDGTGKIAEKLSKKYVDKIKVVHRTGKQGLGSAIKDGILAAGKDIVVVTDADMSHEIEKIPELIKPIAYGDVQLTIGSRYVNGGKTENWPLIRRAVSYCAVLLSRPLTKIKDPISGFFALDKKIINYVELDARSCKILLEIIVKGKYEKYVEIPYTFANRKNGKSKLDASEIKSFLKTVYTLIVYKCSE